MNDTSEKKDILSGERKSKTKTKKVKHRVLSDAERAKRAERMVSIHEKKKTEEGKLEVAVTKMAIGWEKADFKEISEITGLSIARTKELLTDNKVYKNWLKQNHAKIRITGTVALRKLIGSVNDGRLSPYQAGIMFNMLRESFMPTKKDKPQNVVNIGDNRQVKVYYPNFDRDSDKSVESGEIID